MNSNELARVLGELGRAGDDLVETRLEALAPDGVDLYDLRMLLIGEALRRGLGPFGRPARMPRSRRLLLTRRDLSAAPLADRRALALLTTDGQPLAERAAVQRCIRSTSAAVLGEFVEWLGSLVYVALIKPEARREQLGPLLEIAAEQAAPRRLPPDVRAVLDERADELDGAAWAARALLLTVYD